MTQEPIIIPISKGKLIKLLVISLAFTAVGAWILYSQPEVSSAFLNNAIIKYGAATLAVLMGVVGLIFTIRKLGDKKPGLSIDDKGITDNASGVAAGFIPWQDVTQIYIANAANQEFIMIGVSNPKTYINRHTNPLRRKMVGYNFRIYGSPVSITVNGLATSTASLMAQLTERWDAFKTTQG